MSSKQPRKQRKDIYDAPLHRRQDRVAAPLSPDLRERHDTRRVNVRTGDEVEVTRGDHAGESGTVDGVDLDRGKIIVDGVTTEKSDGSQESYPLHPSNVKITSLDTSDPERQKKLEGS